MMDVIVIALVVTFVVLVLALISRGFIFPILVVVGVIYFVLEDNPDMKERLTNIAENSLKQIEQDLNELEQGNPDPTVRDHRAEIRAEAEEMTAEEFINRDQPNEEPTEQIIPLR